MRGVERGFGEGETRRRNEGRRRRRKKKNIGEI